MGKHVGHVCFCLFSILGVVSGHFGVLMIGRRLEVYGSQCVREHGNLQPSLHQ